jgi:hypothetical protein
MRARARDSSDGPRGSWMSAAGERGSDGPLQAEGDRTSSRVAGRQPGRYDGSQQAPDGCGGGCYCCVCKWRQGSLQSCRLRRCHRDQCGGVCGGAADPRYDRPSEDDAGSGGKVPSKCELVCDLVTLRGEKVTKMRRIRAELVQCCTVSCARRHTSSLAPSARGAGHDTRSDQPLTRTEAGAGVPPHHAGV